VIPLALDFLAKAENKYQAALSLHNDAFYEDSASRSYYAMFLVANAFLATQNLSFSKHSLVISKFGELFCKSNLVPHHFHRALIEGQLSRLHADYAPSLVNDKAPSEELLRLSRDFIAFANENIHSIKSNLQASSAPFVPALALASKSLPLIPSPSPSSSTPQIKGLSL